MLSVCDLGFNYKVVLKGLGLPGYVLVGKPPSSSWFSIIFTFVKGQSLLLFARQVA